MGDLIEEVEKDMTPRLLKDLGTRYPTEKSIKKYRYGLYECPYCTKEFETISKSIKSGGTKSCGCYAREAQTTHGMSQNKFYQTWYNMRDRCFNVNNKQYKNYGGRGIIVCEEWLDVRNFVAWAESTHPDISGVSLDRIDNDKGYSPENCRWTDATTQNINQRMQKNNTSGFVGVYRDKNKNRWTTNIKINNINTHIGSFPTKEEAILARDNYIIENKLPHKLSTDYKKETK